MRLIDADALLENLMKYITSGEAENPNDCAVFNSMIKDEPTVDIKDRIKKAVNKCEYRVVDGYMYVHIYDVEKAIDKA